MNYIDSSHYILLGYRVSIGLFFITLFGEALYYKSNIKATVATISTDAKFVAAVSEAKAENISLLS